MVQMEGEELHPQGEQSASVEYETPAEACWGLSWSRLISFTGSLHSWLCGLADDLVKPSAPAGPQHTAHLCTSSSLGPIILKPASFLSIQVLAGVQK